MCKYSLEGEMVRVQVEANESGQCTEYECAAHQTEMRPSVSFKASLG